MLRMQKDTVEKRTKGQALQFVSELGVGQVCRRMAEVCGGRDSEVHWVFAVNSIFLSKAAFVADHITLCLILHLLLPLHITVLRGEKNPRRASQFDLFIL